MKKYKNMHPEDVDLLKTLKAKVANFLLLELESERVAPREKEPDFMT